MAQVIGIGGVFYKAADPKATAAWYRRVLGLGEGESGHAYMPATTMAAKAGAGSVWSLMGADTDYFGPSQAGFMLNLCVDDLDGVLARCAQEGVTPIKRQDESYGRFAHILDPDGVKIELWEPLKG